MVNSSEQMIDKINTILKDKKDALINIIKKTKTENLYSHG